MKQENEKFCVECGQLINIKAELCPKCGVRQQLPSTLVNQEINEQRNKWITCLLLCWFLGVFGVHRFYTGHTAIGVVQVLTFGGCGIWALIDFIIIVTGNFKDAQGNRILNA
jgi:TM2 domain-containing membrane protein YozV